MSNLSEKLPEPLKAIEWLETEDEFEGCSDDVLVDNKPVEQRQEELILLRNRFKDFVNENTVMLRAIAWKKYLRV